MTITPPDRPRTPILIPSTAPQMGASVPPPMMASASAPVHRSAPPSSLSPHKPVGIVNEQNTCFLNSTFQALSATAPLISLLTSSSSSPFLPLSTSELPPPILSPSRIPSLQPDALEPSVYPLLPVTRAFTSSLEKAWRMKEAGGGTSGPGETSSSRSMTLRALLQEMGRKYDQYDDYTQQDAHEFLRHLLDSMEMEEKDVVKRLQPMPPPGKKMNTSRANGDVNRVSPLPSPLVSPTSSKPSSPSKQMLVDPMSAAGLDQSRASSTNFAGPGQVNGGDVPESQKMVPFIDVLFGGSLASVIVCENCKSVSHTYEGFLDISLSLKDEDPKPRKRDRLKAMAQRLRPRGAPGKSPSIEPYHASHTSPAASALSDTELSDTEPKERNRRRSVDQDFRPGEGAPLSRSASTKSFSLKPKTSFSFLRKGSKTSASPSRIATPELERSSTPSVTASPSITARFLRSGPTPAQTAYIQRILAGSHGENENMHPLQRLKHGNIGDSIPLDMQPEYGLVDSLKAFTSVEVLEGDNAFACKKCWKVKSGKYKGGQETLREEDEDLDGHLTTPNSPEFSFTDTKNAKPPTIVVGSDAGSDRLVSPREDYFYIGRDRSKSSRSSGSRPARAPSPLRSHVDDVDRSSTVTIESASIHSSDPGVQAEAESDGLSESDTSSGEDAPAPSPLSIGRPQMPPRKKSSHFVMRRAFKRYLIAKAPEVMVFHLKRFKQTQKTGLVFTSFYDLKKMDDFISFPETIDLAPYLAPNRNDYKVVPSATGPRAPYMDWASPEQGPGLKPVMYRLYAVVVHLGTMIGGHYIAYCLVDPEQMFGSKSTQLADGVASLNINGGQRNGESSSCSSSESTSSSSASKSDRRVWCWCSDTSIRLASLEEVLSAKAYLCFYEKMSS